MSSMINRIANYQHSLSTKTNKFVSKVAIVRMASTTNIEENFLKAQKNIYDCSERGAQLICLPENFAYHGNQSERLKLVSSLQYWFNQYRQLALDNQVWLSLGSFPELCPSDPTKHYQTHYIINNEGNIVTKYRKMHMFDLEMASKGGKDLFSH